MTYLLAILVPIWFCGLLFVAGQYLNDLRIVLNNMAPGVEMSMLPPRPNWVRDSAEILSLASIETLLLAGAALTVGRIFKLERLETWRISRCDPACLTEAGRLQLENAARHERFALIWATAGIAAVVLLSYFSFA